MSVEHASEAAKGASLEILNWVQVLEHFLGVSPAARILRRIENEIFEIIVMAAIGLIFYFGTRKMRLVPGRLQTTCEGIVEGLESFVCGVLGPSGRRHLPFLGSLFLYILFMNLSGIIPLMKAPTSASITLTLGTVSLPIPTVTLSLGFIVFAYVQYHAVRALGVLGYLDHLAGSPRNIIGWMMVPIMFCVHVIGEITKPFSLGYRLFSNIMGEDVLIAVFIGLGIGVSFIPLQTPFLFLAMITGTIQAFVFMLLSTVYLALMLPHEDHEHAHGQEAVSGA